MGEIRLNKIDVSGRRVVYDYTAGDGAKKYFNFSQPFFIEYDEDISMVPAAILVIPFLVNVLPVAWLTGSDIFVESADKTFCTGIPKIKQGFQDMYPSVKFSGNFTVAGIVDCSYEFSGKTAAFFSGGVDSYCTLVRNIGHLPDLITLWGSDIALKDLSGWNRVKKATFETAADFGLGSVFIKSSFRNFINYEALDSEFLGVLRNGWWGGIQHGIGIIGHAAPYAWKHRISVLYFAATLSVKDTDVQWGSYPTVDGEVKFGSCDVRHDSFDYTRQDKIAELACFRKKTGNPVKLRVCWESPGGGNCCGCEKCYRTIMGILVAGGDPNDYNLPVILNRDTFEKIKTLVVWGSKRYISYRYWDPIKQAAVENKPLLKKSGRWKYVKWLVKIDFSDIENNRFRKKQQTGFTVKSTLKEIMPGFVLRKLKK